MGAKQTRYSDECKAMIVELYRNGKTPSEITNEYGLCKMALYQWVNERKEITVENDTVTSLDIKTFKNRIRELEEENEILKKAMTIFAKR
ncbi:transposase [Sulfoacidibacillus ferrooxidans]|uniref:Transposase n=1 Tax=Sulfoacidibacillus ferrooxidans TaxID=2005001 RepID=A0A9X2AD80_9BACL|nr:transposase [Sulfoacidibacillus ferrooxidans]MCI0184599.1 hypothetical protein [Sulfoacidibacillus ferrooxidans]